MTQDPFDLERFVEAQQGSYAQALAEVRRGAKTSHWMWFVFPQIAGLGHSAMAQRYAIFGLDEACGFLAHPVLGPRLREIVEALQALPATSAERVFGQIDAVKLRSCLTLFLHAGGGAPFDAALARWFGGVEDEATVRLLSAGQRRSSDQPGGR
jgi:uncharacterized protein (DUF1810 family)